MGPWSGLSENRQGLMWHASAHTSELEVKLSESESTVPAAHPCPGPSWPELASSRTTRQFPLLPEGLHSRKQNKL